MVNTTLNEGAALWRLYCMGYTEQQQRNQFLPAPTVLMVLDEAVCLSLSLYLSLSSFLFFLSYFLSLSISSFLSFVIFLVKPESCKKRNLKFKYVNQTFPVHNGKKNVKEQRDKERAKEKRSQHWIQKKSSKLNIYNLFETQRQFFGAILALKHQVLPQAMVSLPNGFMVWLAHRSR